MDINRLCPGCMKMKPDDRATCNHCGFDASKYTPDAYYVLPLNTILHGRYLVGRYLGAGGFGVTYIGYDLTLQMPVAIKEFFMRGTMYRDSNVTSTVTTSLSSSDEKHIVESNYRKFREEALTLARLNQLEGIVHVYDCFEENQTMYIIMDYLEGPTLKSYVKNHGKKMTWNETLTLLTPVIRSLGQLHKQNILHRDISPDNMMFGKDGRLCLIDFGGAKEEYVEKADQRSSVALMKPGYSPVEQMTVTGKQGPWTDEYALAATMYYCLCGKAPSDALARMTGEEYTPIRKLNPSVSPTQEAVLAKALAINAADRYPNMEVFLDALLEASGVKTSAPRMTPPPAPSQKPSIALFAIPVVVVAVVAAVAVGIITSHKSKPESEVAVVTEAPNSPEISDDADNVDTDDTSSDAYVDRGYNYANGIGVEQDYEKALKYYRKAADMGNMIAQYDLGIMYDDGTGVEQDYEQALEWYQLSADQGFADAQTNIGFMYETGHGVDQDYEKAAEFYKKAADQGSAVAQTNLGTFYRDGLGVDQNYSDAAKLFGLAADQEYDRAQYLLGMLCEYGNGVDQDYVKAAEYFKMAADQGNADAQTELGYFYDQGFGVTQDYETAYGYFKQAADQGNKIAQYDLGYYYENGYYVNADLDKAISYYQMSADQGYKNAQDSLERLNQ